MIPRALHIQQLKAAEEELKKVIALHQEDLHRVRVTREDLEYREYIEQVRAS